MIFETNNIDDIVNYQDIFYDNKHILQCPNCNNFTFYVNNYLYHECPMNNQSFKINIFLILKIMNLIFYVI